MKLRTRMVLTTALIVTPLLVGVVWIDAWTRRREAKAGLEKIALTHMLRGERARCEEAPERWGGRALPPPDEHDRPLPGPPRDGPHRPPPGRDHGPHDGAGPGRAPPVLFAYDASLRSRNTRAPDPRGQDASLFPGARVRVLTKMPWQTGPCAYVLALGSSSPGLFEALVPTTPVWLVPIGAALVGFVLSTRPFVRRLERLRRDVSASAKSGFRERVQADGDDEITTLAEAFGAASDEVRAQLDEKDRRERALRDYLASTTHDVMIPLTVLQAHLTTIHEQRMAGEAIDPAVILQAMNEAHYLGSLTHNLGVSARLDADERHVMRVPVDLAALVERVLARHKPVAAQRDVSIDGAVPEEPLVMLGDVTLLEQAVNNVVYNSIRYNRAGGSVGITLDRLPGSRFRIRVVDDGPGIGEADIARLVERGFRGNEARTRAPEGQGLGLTITFRVAEALGLTLRFARSEYGGLEVDLVGDAITPERGPSA